MDQDAEAEWQKEIARRIQDLDSGKVRPVAWAEARQQIWSGVSPPLKNLSLQGITPLLW